MRKLLSAAALVCAAAWFVAPAGADDKDGAMRLKGGYTIVSGERDGKPIPAGEIKGTTVRFTEDEIIVADKDDKHIYVAKYTLDPAKKPCVIKMIATAPKSGEEATGLIEKTGDTVKIIYNLPGGKAPDDFKTDEKQQLFVLKNTKKGGGRPATGRNDD